MKEIVKLYNPILLYHSDTNTVYKFDNIRAFCNDMNLPLSAIHHLIAGRAKESNGFTVA